MTKVLTREKLEQYLRDLLSCSEFQDYAPNGLQVEGRSSIQSICTAVTASASSIERAIALGADAMLVHHGFFWRGEEAVVTGMRRARLARLLGENMNLFAYHLPLDCHATLGNNATLGQRMGLQDVKAHTVNKVSNILWSGHLPKPLTPAELTEKITQVLQRPPLFITSETPVIRRIAWCTGAAQDFITEAKNLGVDAYLSGEVSERTYYQAQELQIHYLACGHHATERFGIQALGEHLATTFQLTHHFIDSPNPV